jgi:acylphosphatase
MAENSLTRLHATVEGYVQGVGFRAFVMDQAGRQNLTGWVRNRWDGSVEVIAEGGKKDLETLLNALYRGPRSASVRGVRADWLPATGEFTGFRVRFTSD